MTYRELPDSTVTKPWVLHLICCERDDGLQYCDTWDEADRFRRDYMSGPGISTTGRIGDGHVRSAILSRNPFGPSDPQEPTP